MGNVTLKAIETAIIDTLRDDVGLKVINYGGAVSEDTLKEKMLNDTPICIVSFSGDREHPMPDNFGVRVFRQFNLYIGVRSTKDEQAARHAIYDVLEKTQKVLTDNNLGIAMQGLALGAVVLAIQESDDEYKNMVFYDLPLYAEYTINPPLPNDMSDYNTSNINGAFSATINHM